MESNLYEHFASSMSRHPDATALEVADARLSYAELSDLVDRLARQILITAGRRRPDRVALLASRSLAAYAGYLAILRLSATVVPLSPDSPPRRNAEICRAADVTTLIVDRAGARQVRDPAFADAPVQVVDLADDRWATTLDEAGDDLDGVGEAAPGDPAYLMFTSGSTGRPKGVVIRHANVLPFLEYHIAAYQAGPGCRFSQTFELTFDPSVFDLFVVWGSGAALVVPSRRELMMPSRFVSERKITHWYSVPSLVSMATELGTLQDGSMPDLRYSLFAGEPLKIGQARDWLRAAPNSRIENLYGPTELTITCTRYQLPEDERDWPATSNGTVPIGPVHAHLEACLVEDGLTHATEGELCVRGPQRFNGYLDNADNAGRLVLISDGVMVSEPSPVVQAEHWYRTGDRVRLEDGRLVHAGRVDDQIKVTGHRVEPGDVEAALRDVPGIADACVTTGRSPDLDVELVALYTGQPQPEEDLLSAMRHRLPVFMVPMRYFHVEVLPLNANGKTDRRQAAALVQEAALR